MISESIISCSFFSIAGILLLGGIPCWIVGAIRPKHYISEFLYSIPLFPESVENTLAFWSFSNRNAGIQDSNQLIFPVSSSDFPKKHLNKNIDIHILHNLWGLRVSGSIAKNHINQDDFLYIHNIHQNEFFNRSVYPGDLPSDLRKYGDYRIKCPFPTLITQENQIETQCSRKIGSFMNLDGPFVDIIIGTIKIGNNDALSLIFDELKALPYDFVFTPQMYLGFWKKSNANKLIFSGVLLTVVGLIILIISVVIFFACFPGSNDDVGTDRN